MYEEFSDRLIVISVALDKSPEDARRWIERVKPTHPSLIDTSHHVADLYAMVNVPTVVWIDERGRIARPNDVAFGTDTYRELTGIEAGKCLSALRAWVRGESRTLEADEIRSLQTLPTDEMQRARAEAGLARWLAERGRVEAAERHFVRAGELAPQDFTIRRGSMPVRGIDPMGPKFAEMVQDWTRRGQSYYKPLPE
jgi:hypothetical protein